MASRAGGISKKLARKKLHPANRRKREKFLLVVPKKENEKPGPELGDAPAGDKEKRPRRVVVKAFGRINRMFAH